MPSSLADALNKINAFYGTFFTEEDIVAQPGLSGATQVTLVAASTSYMFIPGSTIVIGS